LWSQLMRLPFAALLAPLPALPLLFDEGRAAAVLATTTTAAVTGASYYIRLIDVGPRPNRALYIYIYIYNRSLLLDEVYRRLFF
jgi:hypothetical protein